MVFSYNADKGKCYGVTADTMGPCEQTIADDSGKWFYYEFWCSEGYTEVELCVFEKFIKKYKCAGDSCETEKNLGQDGCEAKAIEQGLEYYSWNKKKDKCVTCPGSVDLGESECGEDENGTPYGEYDKKSKIYKAECAVEGYISKEYLCDASDNAGTYAEGMRCGLTTNADSFTVSTQAECNDFAIDNLFDFYAYSEELALCYLGNNEAENFSCRNTQLEEQSKWNVYAACQTMQEPFEVELARCAGLEWCTDESLQDSDCFVAWTDVAESWKCEGATQTDSGVSFLDCVNVTSDGDYKWMNFKTKNGACAVLDECTPESTGSYWQIFLNCAVVHAENERRN